MKHLKITADTAPNELEQQRSIQQLYSNNMKRTKVWTCKLCWTAFKKKEFLVLHCLWCLYYIGSNCCRPRSVTCHNEMHTQQAQLVDNW